MAHAVLLQDWITIRGGAAGEVTQAEDMYADLSPYGDVVAFMEVSDFTAGTIGYHETSPTKDNQFFSPMHATAIAPAVGVTTYIYRYSTATLPLARWVRWRFSHPTTAWTITFRIWLSPNPSGTR